MTLTIEAVYENGVLKPERPLPLKEHEKVRLQVDTVEDALQRVRATAGLIPWTGDHETLERIPAEAEELP